MQQPVYPMVPMPQNPPSNITTEQIQKYLDENKQLILAIMDNQNLGRLSECAQYQALLQKNLLFLAAVADAQPQAPSVRPQMMPHGVVQQGGHYIQQSPIFPPRASFNSPLQQQPQLTPFRGPRVMGPTVVNGMHTEASHGANVDHPQGAKLAEFPPGGPHSGSGTSESAASAADGHGSESGDPTLTKKP